MAQVTKKYDVTVESGIIAIFQSQTYKLERVFAEFIDNSLQSYLDHSEQLSKCLMERDVKSKSYGMIIKLQYQIIHLV